MARCSYNTKVHSFPIHIFYSDSCVHSWCNLVASESNEKFDRKSYIVTTSSVYLQPNMNYFLLCHFFIEDECNEVSCQTRSLNNEHRHLSPEEVYYVLNVDWTTLYQQTHHWSTCTANYVRMIEESCSIFKIYQNKMTALNPHWQKHKTDKVGREPIALGRPSDSGDLTR